MMQTQPRRQEQKPSSADAMFSQLTSQARSQFQPHTQTSQSMEYGTPAPSNLLELDPLFSHQTVSPTVTPTQQQPEQKQFFMQKQQVKI